MSNEFMTTVTVPQDLNPFDEGSYGSSPKEATTAAQPTDMKVEPVPQQAAADPVQPKVEPTPTPEPDEEIIDANEYLKNNLGFEDWEQAKAEIEQLRKLKENPTSSFKFENEQSQKLFEAFSGGKEDDIYNYLHQKRELARAEKLDPNNPNDASEIIRLNLRLKHADLSESEIADMFDETYGKPQKPVQGIAEDEEDYQIRLAEWQQKAAAIDKKIVRDSKIVRPELLSYNQKIVLPNIGANDTQQAEPTQEELAAQRQYVEGFLKSAKEALGTLNEISAAVTDKDVQFAASYGISQEEKSAIEQQVQTFAETNFDANAIFAERWLNKDGTLNSQQMVKDLSLLQSGDKAISKIASEAANKRLEAYLKEKKNVNVSAEPRAQFAPDSPNGDKWQQLQAQVWGT